MTDILAELARLQALARLDNPCTRCGGSGRCLAYEPLLYECDSPAEREDARQLAMGDCPDCKARRIALPRALAALRIAVEALKPHGTEETWRQVWKENTLAAVAAALEGGDEH